MIIKLHRSKKVTHLKEHHAVFLSLWTFLSGVFAGFLFKVLINKWATVNLHTEQ